MKLVILDIVSNNFEEVDKYISTFENCQVLALTPSSFYYLNKKNIEFISFHQLISTEDFRKESLSIYDDILAKNVNSKYFKGFFRDIAQYICQLLFIEKIILFTKNNAFDNIIYITDKRIGKEFDYLSNNESILNIFLKFNNIIQIKKNSFGNKIKFFDKLKRYSLSHLIKKIINKFSKNNLTYDWEILNPKGKDLLVELDNMKVNFDLSHDSFTYVDFKSVEFTISKSSSKVSNFLTFLDKNTYLKALKANKVDKNIFFYQHGSYLYKNLFINYSEVEPAKVNFVFNDYTKEVFENLGAKQVHSVGSIWFNHPIKKRKKEYDFAYITQGHDYLGNLQYVDFPNSLHSFDGYELYQRHKNIIHLFGTKFKDKKIIIRVHPCVVTNGLYVPFWELAEKYPNITIDVSTPIHTLIEKSKYIISDYFTSEFINRELHYKRDIILFKGIPTPLPEETLEDMEKMFILVDSVNELKEKVENIENITKNRKRYDDIIEYYSSKKCNTKKIVASILEKNCN